jgi:hypothetical protein
MDLDELIDHFPLTLPHAWHVDGNRAHLDSEASARDTNDATLAL